MTTSSAAAAAAAGGQEKERHETYGTVHDTHWFNILLDLSVISIEWMTAFSSWFHAECMSVFEAQHQKYSEITRKEKSDLYLPKLTD